jgi:hypothetical protein
LTHYYFLFNILGKAFRIKPTDTKNMNISNAARVFSWWLPILAVDVSLIIATILIRFAPPASTAWEVLKHFNLAYEMNIAAWWSSMNLLMAAMLAYELFSTRRDTTRTAWLVLAIILTMLSWDELGSFHERVSDDGWSALLPFAAAICLGLAYIFYKLFLNKRTRNSALLLLLGCGLLAFIPLVELLESRILLPEALRGIRDGFEEGLELLGIFFCLWSIVQQHQHQADTLPLRRILPNPAIMKALPLVLILGGVMHVYVAVLARDFLDIGRRGDPTLWYPSALFWLICIHALERLTARESLHPIRWLVVACFFATASPGVVYLMPQPSLVGLAALLVAALLFVTIFNYLRRETIGIRDVSFALGFALLLISNWLADDYLVRALVTGLFVLSAVLLMVWRTEKLASAT